MCYQLSKASAVGALILSLFLALPAWAVEDATSKNAASRSVNSFALRAAALLGEKPEDFFFSPFSVVPTLGMTYAGARGETAREMEAALLFSSDIHASLGTLTRELTDALNGENGAPLLTSANRVWLRDGLTLRPDFSVTLLSSYGSAAQETDFKGDPEGSKKKINAWVEKQTHDRIRGLIQKIEPDTQMILTNAVYFMGEWAEPFNEKNTEPTPFHLSATETRDVSMMKKHKELAYGEANEGRLKLLRLPYKGRLSLLLALPSEDAGGMEKTLELLSGEKGLETFEGWRKSLSPYEVDLWLPKFRVERRYELKELLSALGMRLAFQNGADFSGMTDDERLKIDSVIHQTFIEVDERKTEAAAATSVTMVRATAVAPRQLPRAEFHADHPFFYFVMDDSTGTILFMGRQGFTE